MMLLKSTLFAAVFLMPGVISLGLALAPRARAIRKTGLSTRVFGILLFSVANWALALWLYRITVRDCGKTLTTLLFEEEAPRNAALADLLSFPPSIFVGSVCMALAIVFTGGLTGLVHSASLMGLAIHDFRLGSALPSCKHGWALRLFLGSWLWCPACGRRFRLATAKVVDWGLRRLGLVNVVQPLGAGYWLVILEAARVLQWSSSSEDEGERVPRVYADVVQGDEVLDGKIGVLYRGTVKHLVCESDGNMVFLLLERPSRWRRGRPQGQGSDKELVLPGGAKDSQERSPWAEIERSAAFALEGRSIRNISFRIFDKLSLKVDSKDPWLKLKQAMEEGQDAG